MKSTNLLLVWALTVSLPVTALASDSASAEPQGPSDPANQQGPLQIEKLGSGLVGAPDFKITDVDDSVGTLVGGYVGWSGDDRFLIGGSGYWLANGESDRKMAYGGLLVGWTFRGDRRIAFGSRALVGAGEARLSEDFLLPSRNRGRVTRASGAAAAESSIARVVFDQGFFVVEPQASLVIRLSNTIRLDSGVGYRVIGGADGFEDRLRGVSGSIAIRFGAGQ